MNITTTSIKSRIGGRGGFFEVDLLEVHGRPIVN